MSTTRSSLGSLIGAGLLLAWWAGSTYFFAKSYHDDRSVWDRTLQENVTMRALINRRAVALQEGDFEKAIACCSQLLELHQVSPQDQFLIGRLCVSGRR